VSGFQISALSLENTHQSEGILLSRLAFEHVSIQALGLVQSAFPVVSQSRLEQGSEGTRRKSSHSDLNDIPWKPNPSFRMLDL
jgi:hypothetical protein